MKGKRSTTEDKIRILRDADRGKSILEVCREHNLSEVSFHRWKRQFGQMDLSEARRLKAPERENGELKKMLAVSLLKNHVLEVVAGKKMVSPAHRRQAAHAVVRRAGCAPGGWRAASCGSPVPRFCIVAVHPPPSKPGWPSGYGR